MQDHKLFIESMADEVRAVKEQIEERRNWQLAMALKFKRMGMRFIDRVATANAFRCISCPPTIFCSVLHFVLVSCAFPSLFFFLAFLAFASFALTLIHFFFLTCIFQRPSTVSHAGS
jgi:hypothetical protein